MWCARRPALAASEAAPNKNIGAKDIPTSLPEGFPPYISQRHKGKRT